MQRLEPLLTLALWRMSKCMWMILTTGVLSSAFGSIQRGGTGLIQIQRLTLRESVQHGRRRLSVSGPTRANAVGIPCVKRKFNRKSTGLF